MTDRPGLVFAEDLDAWRAWQVQQRALPVRLVRAVKDVRRGRPVPRPSLRPKTLVGTLRRWAGRCPECGRADLNISAFCSAEHMQAWFIRLARRA